MYIDRILSLSINKENYTMVEMNEVKSKNLSTREIALVGMFAAVLTVCSWITLPLTVPFTMQTFAVFLILILLGGKLGTYTIGVYLFMGAVGLPVFSGMSGGLGRLFGTTGGYLLGFIAMALLYWAMEKVFSGKSFPWKILALILGLAMCYAVGTWWFVTVYTQDGESMSYTMAATLCVFPFIIPDISKLVLALVVADRLKVLKKTTS